MTAPVISADSHVVEPVTLWQERLDRSFRHRAPRVYWESDRNGWFFACDNLRPALINSLYSTDKSPEEFADGLTAGLESARPGGSDPGPRRADQERDGVAGEVLYPSLAMSLFWLRDAPFQRACFRAYNDWLAEFVARDPHRLVGQALISLWDADEAVKELERCRAMGLRGASIWASPPDERAFTGAANDPFWQAAQDLETPVSMHCLTGFRDSPKLFDYEGPMGRIQRNMGYPEEIQHSLTDLIFSGVLERFPQLRLVMAENDIGWIGYHLLHADRIHDKLGPVLGTGLSMSPGEYFRRQVFATFTEDEIGVLTMRRLGSGNFMWGSDYPHYEGSWPRSQDVIEQGLRSVPEADRDNVLCHNAASLYGFDRAVIAPR